jgi:hypothetical protein
MMAMAIATLLASPLAVSAQTDTGSGFWPHGSDGQLSDAAPLAASPTWTGFASRALTPPSAWTTSGPRLDLGQASPADSTLTQLHLASGGGLNTLGGQPLVLGRYGPSDPTMDILGRQVSAAWPEAIRLRTGAFGFDLSPHAGLGVSGAGGGQTAGAVLRFGQGLGRADGEGGRRASWYLFASTDRESLGYSFMRGEDAWKRAGINSDPGAQIGDTRAGLAWNRGPMEASFGYLYREVHPRDLDFQAQTMKESLVSLKLTYRPTW